MKSALHTAPAETCASTGDRRVWERRVVDPLGSAILVATVRDKPGLALVQDISPAGVRILSSYPLQPGQLLALSIRNVTGSAEVTVLARVIHVGEAGDGHSLVGCALLSPVSHDELNSLFVGYS